MQTMANFSHAKFSLFPLSIIILIIKILFLTSLSEATNPKPFPSQFSKFTRSSLSSSTSPICKGTPYTAACESLLLSLKTTSSSPLPKTPKQLFDHSVQFSLSQTRSALNFANSVLLTQSSTKKLAATAMNDCFELLDDTLHQISNVINGRRNGISTHNDIQTWLSAALTNQETCKESLENGKLLLEKEVMESMAHNLSQYISNSLSLFVSNYYKLDHGRKLLSDHYDNNFPSWVSLSERKLLEASIGEIEAHAVVAKDGSGTHKTIGEAIGVLNSLASGSGSGGKTVIYVKAGTYNENLKLPTKQRNVLLVGDGKGKTVIVSSKSAGDGSTTYNSATVGVMGDGFMARDITFVNSAGPNKQQAVALRVGSDRSVIYRCSILGYQDTLYTLSKRQFYRETDIYGTVDFIFGNSAVVFQNCNINVRKPMSDQKNFVTAQGRTSPDQNTGISIHNCQISSAGASPKSTYLGRPWKEYSRTIIMQSSLDDIINPAGWYPWAGGSSPKNLYYGEYMNSGPGASVSGRVKWPGYHATLTSAQAQPFTVGSFIAGNTWLPSTGVSFDSGLIG